MWCSEGHGEDTSPVRMEDSHAICFACFLTSDDSLLSLSSSVHYAYSGSSDMSEAWVNEPNGSEPRRMSPVSCFDRFHLIQRAGGGWVWRGKERGTSDWHTHLTTILTAASWFRLFLTSSPSLAAERSGVERTGMGRGSRSQRIGFLVQLLPNDHRQKWYYIIIIF